MPAQDGLRLHDLSQPEQLRVKPGYPDQPGPIASWQLRPERHPPQCDGELMAQQEVFSPKPPSRFEQISDEDRGSP
jgi:hypothetical protein